MIHRSSSLLVFTTLWCFTTQQSNLRSNFRAAVELSSADNEELVDIMSNNTSKIDSKNPGSFLCRFTKTVTFSPTNASNSNAFETDTVTLCVPPETGGLDNDMPVQLPDWFERKHHQKIAAGRLLVSVEGDTSVNEDTGELVLSNSTTLRVLHKNNGDPLSRGLFTAADFAWTTGTKSLAIVHVSASDATPLYSLGEVQDAMLGTGRVSMKTQYEACSFNQLRFVGAGSYEVILGEPIRKYKTRQAMVDAAEAKLSEMVGSDLKLLADKVLFCYPPSDIIQPWFASATVSHWRFQLSSNWCTSLSGSIHELAHTMGVLHSGLGSDEVGDRTGYMGTGGSAAYTPRKCFNGAKHAQLGWFQSKQLDLTIQDIQSLNTPVTVAAFVDYDKAQSRSDMNVIVSVGSSLYIQYNRAKAHNVDTEQPDTVTVTMDLGLGGRSLRLAALQVGETSQVNAGKGVQLNFKVCSVQVGDSNTPDTAVVSISSGGDNCGAPPVVIQVAAPKALSSQNNSQNKCFANGDELRQAVGAYVNSNNDPQSTVAQTYGYPIGNWCVDKVDDFSLMFAKYTSFNEPLTNWNTGSATTMDKMFMKASSFNQDISHFATGRVTDMARMFRAADAFNSDISSWDVRNVQTMERMFYSANDFNQNLCKWNNQMQPSANKNNMFSGTACPVVSDPTCSGSVCTAC
jgi:surface protein